MMGNRLSGKSWPIALVAVIASVALVIAFAASSWMGLVCEKSGIDAGKPLVPGVYGCIEFWLNRYQSTVAALVAIVAAGLAWKGVQGQIETSKQQVDVANRQFAASALAPLQQRADTLKKIRDAIADACASMLEIEGYIYNFNRAVNDEIDEDPSHVAECIRLVCRRDRPTREKTAASIKKMGDEIHKIRLIYDKETYESAVSNEIIRMIRFLAKRHKTSNDNLNSINLIALDAHDMSDDHIEIAWGIYHKKYEISRFYNREEIMMPVIAAAEKRITIAIDKTIHMIEG